MLSDFYVKEHIKNALKEDIGFGDITTENLTSDNDFLKGELNTRNDGVLCGLEIFKTVFAILSDKIVIKPYFKDGDIISKGNKIADIEGPAKELLMGERVALNYIQRMSGIATETKKYQDLLKGSNARITDTRKTTPNFRAFEKYAVKTGGGALHRFNLSDCVMIKDNHIRLAGSISNAVNKIKENISHAHKIEVECDTIEQVKEALACQVDIILLDNMDVQTMTEACKLINNNAIVEASGNITLENLKNIASCGVDIISTSAIVAKAPTLDIALDI